MKRITLALFIVGFLLSSCGSSTKLVNSWSNKEEIPKKFEKLAIAALTPSNSNRYIIERAIVDKLKEQGIQTIPTYEVLPMAGRIGEFREELEDSEAIKKMVRQKINENEIDALLVMALLNKQSEKRWVNDRNIGYGGTGYYGSPYAVHGAYYNYYAYTFGSVYNEGYYVDDVTYFVECNLYQVDGEVVLWSGQIKIKNYKSVEEEADVLAYIISKQLVNKKVITP